MRFTVAVFSLFISIIVFSQEDEALNFEEGVELAHYNYLNESLSISDKELGSFWGGYEEMKQNEAEIKARQQRLKKSLMYGFMKSDDEIISIVQQIAELDMLKIETKRDFIISCINILDATRAIEFSIHEKEFKKMVKSYNSKQ